MRCCPLLAGPASGHSSRRVGRGQEQTGTLRIAVDVEPLVPGLGQQVPWTAEGTEAPGGQRGSRGSGALNGWRLGRLVTAPAGSALAQAAASPVSVLLLGLLLCPWLACRPRRAVWAERTRASEKRAWPAGLEVPRRDSSPRSVRGGLCFGGSRGR